MKARFILLAVAMSCALAFTACDVEEFIKETVNNIVDEISGDLTLTASNPNYGTQPYAEGDTVGVPFVACGTDSAAGHLRFAGIQGKLENGVLDATNFPVFTIGLTDSLAGNHSINYSLGEVSAIISNDWNDIATGSGNSNIFILAVDKDNYYISTSGIVTIDSVGQVGDKAAGSLNNVTCSYISSEKVDNIRNLISLSTDPNLDPATRLSYADSLSNIDPDTYFPTIVFNGRFNATRTNITKYMNAIENMED